MNKIFALFTKLKKEISNSFSASIVAELLEDISLTSHYYLLTQGQQVELISKVKDKSYTGFSSTKGKLSRPLNKDLFIMSDADFKVCLKDLFNDNVVSLNNRLLRKTLYTLGMCFPCYIDVVKQGDKKIPGSFYEYLIGHLIARRFGSNPRTRLEIPIASDEEPRTLPTDLIFDMPVKSYGLHVPIKSTTRERVIQVWAHQRILDSVYGTGRFKGMLVIASETKLDTKTREVIEICLPSQWRIYQLHISQLKRIYYLDPPEAYLKLNDIFPNIPVKYFSDFFTESITSF